MKTLMLGWEFPPHISGGLGTACYGLTQGLHQHGVDILFVVPRRFGDEDQRAIELLSCEEALASHVPSQLTGNARVVPSSLLNTIRHLLASSASSYRNSLTLSGHYEDGYAATGWKTIAIDSALHPYLTERSYLDLKSSSSLMTKLSASRSRSSNNGAKTQGTRNDPHVPHQAPCGAESPSSPTSHKFGGQYGRNLLEEVAIYARATANLAFEHCHDVIHAHDWMTYPAAIWARSVSGRPLIVHLHASEYDRSGENVNRDIREIEKNGLEAADRIICVSHYTSAQIQRRYGINPDKIRVVHNAVDQTRSQKFTGQKSIPEPIVLFLGRITFQKGPDYFLEAARRVIQVEKNVKFVMAGSGDMLPSMIEQAAAVGIAEHIHFTGFLCGEDVERMYAMADLYIMPSVSEPFGIAPLEAISQHVPVIISKQSGVAEVLNHALKVDFWDVNDLASKILAVLRLPTLRENLVEGSHQEILQMQWSLRGEKVRKIYEELVQ